jgi:hypothetical protein
MSSGTLFGYQAQTYQGQAMGPFDIKGISEDVARAVSAVPADKRGSVVMRLNKDGAGAGIGVRGPFSMEIFGSVYKPMAGRFEWSVQGKVNFIKSPYKLPVRVCPQVRGWYRVFRKIGKNPITAAVKAVQLANGVEVSIG